jgi:hypothetical protein
MWTVFLIRDLKKLGVVASIGLVGVLVGCQRQTAIAPADELSAQPILVDGAMQLRNWPATSATYENWSVVAGPHGFWWEQKYDNNGHYTGPGGEQNERVAAVTDSPLFLANLVTLPVALIVTPPWAEVLNSGGAVPPTHTAAYPLTPVR